MSDIKCLYHPDKLAEFQCAGCHRLFCPLCIEEISGKTYCEICYAKLVKREIKSQDRKRSIHGTTSAGLIVITLDIPLALIFSIIFFRGTDINLGHAVLIITPIFTGFLGLVLFMIGVILSRTHSLRRPILAIIVGFLYIASLSGYISAIVQDYGFMGMTGLGLLVSLSPGLLPVVIGLTLLIVRGLKGRPSRKMRFGIR